MSNKNNIFMLLLVCFVVMSLVTIVYADKSVEYEFDDVQIEYLFASEQEILKDYEIKSNTEDIPEELQAPSNITEDNLAAVENITVDTVVLEEYIEEYVTKDRKTAKREVDSLDGSLKHIWPVEGYTNISSPYGWRNCPFHGREYHSGIDVPAPSGTPIKATKNGTVITSTNGGGYGNYVVIQHRDGGKTLYAHMVKRYVSVGDEVSQGDVIGGVGTTGNSTGNHLHFEIWTGSDESTRVNPMSCY